MSSWCRVATICIAALVSAHAMRRDDIAFRPGDGRARHARDGVAFWSDVPAAYPDFLAAMSKSPGRSAVRRDDFDIGLLRFVGEFLPLRRYLVAVLSVNSVVSCWEVRFSPRTLMGPAAVRPLSRVAVGKFGFGHVLGGFGERVEFLPPGDTLMITGESPRDTIFWDPYNHVEAIGRLPIPDISAVSFRGDLVAAPDAAEKGSVSVWQVKTARCTKMMTSGPAWFVTFSPDGDKLAALVDLNGDVRDGGLLQVLSASSGKLLCGAPAPFGALTFVGESILVHGHYWKSFSLRKHLGEGSCELVGDPSDTPAGDPSATDVHWPSWQTLELNATALVVRRGGEVLHHAEWQSIDVRGFLSPDGRSAFIFSTSVRGEFGTFLWMFADGMEPMQLHDLSPRIVYSQDGAVLAHLSRNRSWMNLLHTRGGGSVRFPAEESTTFRRVTIGPPQTVGA